MDERHPAGFFERAGALAIEVALFVGISGSLFMLWGTIVAPFGGSVSMPWWPWSNLVEAGVVAALLAYAWRRKNSPGAEWLSLEVVDAKSGFRPSLLQCLIRAAFTVVAGAVAFMFAAAVMIAGAPHGLEVVETSFFLWPSVAFATLLLSYLPMRFTRRRQSLWDILTRTAVVQRAKQSNRAPMVASQLSSTER